MKFIVVAGARPNFMKVAPILEAFASEKAAGRDFTVLLVHTGQHYDEKMSGTFFEELGIPPPDIHLGVGSGSHAEQTARVMVSFERVCLDHSPDWVIVVGDVNSTFACSVTAKKLGIKVAHVEAGLRSRDMSMPEEINRLCTDAVSDLFFTTDEFADANLAAEGVAPDRIILVGNTMIDTLIRHQHRALAMELPSGAQPRQYAVLTLHRPSNVDDPQTLERLFGAVRRIAERIPIYFPVHPRTRRNLEAFGLLNDASAESNVFLIEPLGYLAFLGLVARSCMVLTDSGGIQEETTFLGIPCLTMRDNTERPITCSLGTNVLVGSDSDRIVQEAIKVLTGESPIRQVPPYWDGRAGERIVDRLLQ